jgi:hypothetical protein
VTAHSVRTKRIFYLPCATTLLNLRSLGACPGRHLQNVHMRYTFKPAPGKGLVCRDDEISPDCSEIEGAIAIAYSVSTKRIFHSPLVIKFSGISASREDYGSVAQNRCGNFLTAPSVYPISPYPHYEH